MHAADTPLVVAELPTASGCVLGTLTLNVESSLNSPTLEMIRAMTAALGAWRSRDDIAAIVLTGRGSKAFCAGGDIQALYRSDVANQGWVRGRSTTPDVSLPRNISSTCLCTNTRNRSPR